MGLIAASLRFLTPRGRLKAALESGPLGQRVLARYFRPRPWDAFLISYPKCGRTWLRAILGKTLILHFRLRAADALDLRKIADLKPGVPRIQVAHSGRPQFKTPSELQIDWQQFEGSRVLLLVRDPRDVVVSNYFQATRRESYFSGSMAEFIRHERYGAGTLIRFMNLWLSDGSRSHAFAVLRYEDLQSDTFAATRRVLAFLGLEEVEDAVVKTAVEFAAFDNMRRIERTRGSRSFRLKPGDPNDPESFKVRRGKIGGYADYLSREDIRFLNEKIDSDLDPAFGYHGTDTETRPATATRGQRDFTRPRGSAGMSDLPRLHGLVERELDDVRRRE